MSAAPKTAAFGELRARLLSGTVELYDEPQLIAELRRLRARHTAGQASVVNPRVGGSHGDLAQALALAVHEHGAAGSPGGAAPADGFLRRPRPRPRPVLAAARGDALMRPKAFSRPLPGGRPDHPHAGLLG